MDENKKTSAGAAFGRLFCGDVLGQLEMHWSRPFLLRKPKGFADGCRNNRRADDLARHLC